MKINVKDKSTGVTKVNVRRKKSILDMSEEELIKAIDLKKKIIDWHYNIEDRYHEVSDIYSGELIEYVTEELYNYSKDSEIDCYEDIALKLINKLQEEVIEEIYNRDDNAVADYNEREEARMGEY